MSGTSGDDVIYRREKHKAGPAAGMAEGAEEEVEQLLKTLQSDFGGYYLEVQTIERMRNEDIAFKEKKNKLKQRSEEPAHWKHHELEAEPLKKEMRKLLGEEKVLDLEVYVGLDDDKIARGIAKTGFATTKCRNNWFAKGHYVTTKAWYAARYGLDGCYHDTNGGILDPRSEIAVGKQGRLLVCRAVMSNVYPITRGCKEDHAIQDFAEAAKQGNLQLFSKWYDEDSEKGRPIKDGYDAHYVRVKKKDADTYSNFQACQDDDVLKESDDLADELVILEEDQLLPKYLVYFHVRKRKSHPLSSTEGFVLKVNSPISAVCYSSSCSEHSSSTGGSTIISRSSTVKGLDSPRFVSVLLVFTEIQDQNYMLQKRDILNRQGFSATIAVVTSSLDMRAALKKREPSIVYIEGPPSGTWPLRRLRRDLHLIEELVLMLGDPRPDQEWTQWRGCVLNFGVAEQEIVDKVCDSHPGKLHFLTWAKQPTKSEMDDLWSLFFEQELVYHECQQRQQEAFEKASLVSFSTLFDMLVTAPMQDPTGGKQELHLSSQDCSRFRSLFPSRLLRSQFGIKGDRGAFNLAKGAMGRLRRSRSSTLSCVRTTPARASSTAHSRWATLQSPNASVEAKVFTNPDVDWKSVNIISDDAKEFEDRITEAFPEEVRGGGIGFTGFGSFHLRMDIKAFDWLCDRIEGSDEPLYFGLPMAWGGGEVRVQKVLLGETCWFEAVARADDVHAICNKLREELTKGDDHEKKEINLPGNDEEHRATPPGESGALEGFWCDSSGRSFKFTAMGSQYYFEMITNRSSSNVRGMLAWKDGWYHGALMDGNHKSGYKVDKYIRLRLHQDKIMMTLEETKLFGSNDYGQTSLPDLDGKKVVSAAAGGGHTVLVLEDGTAKIFGDNDYGQTSLPDLGGKKVVSAAAGVCHTVLVLEDGTAKVFGDNDCGQTSLPDLGGRKVVSAAAGGGHTVLVLEDGTAKVFGDNDYGQTSLPDLGGKKVVSAAAGGDHTVLVLEDGTAKVFGDYRYGQTSLPDLGGKKVVSAAAGGRHTVLVLEDGTAKIFGDNNHGQTDLPDLGGKKVVSAAAGGEHTVLVLEDGTAKILGYNDHGQTSLPDLGGKKVVSSAASGGHTVLVLEEEDIVAHPQKAEIGVPAGPWVAGSVFEVRIQEQPSDDYMLKAHITKAFTGDLVEALTVSKHKPIHDLRDAILKRAQESSKEAAKQVKFISKGREITGELDKHSKLSHGDQLTLHLSGYQYFFDGVGFEVELSKYGADEFEKDAMEYAATPSLDLAETAYLWAEILVKNFWYLQFPQPIGAGWSIGERAVVEEQLQKRWEAEILDKWKSIFIFEKQKVSKKTYAECASTPKHKMQVNDACEKVLLQAMEQQRHEQADLLPYKGALARCWMEMGRHKEAEDIFRQNLEVQTEKLGHSHLGTLASKNTLAAFLTTERRYAEAEPILCQSLEAYEAELGVTHQSTLDCRNKLAELLPRVGKHHEAESLLRQSLEALEKELGPHHPSTLDCEERLHRGDVLESDSLEWDESDESREWDSD